MGNAAFSLEGAGQRALGEARVLYNAFKLEEAAALARNAAGGSELGPRDRGQLHLLAADAMRWLRNDVQAEVMYTEAAACFAEAQDPLGELEAKLGGARFVLLRGNMHEAMHLAASADAAVSALQSPRLEMRAASLSCVIAEIGGDLHGAAEHCARALDLLRGLDLPVEHAETMARYAICLARTDRAAEGLECGTAAAERFKQAGFDTGLGYLEDKLAVIAWNEGDFQGARAMFARRLEAQRNAGKVTVDNLFNACLSEFACGFHSAARRLHIQFFDFATSQGQARRVPPSCMLRTLVELHLDEPAEALHFALLARDNHLEQSDMEARLVPYYLAVAQLAAGMLEQARASWALVQPLAPVRDNHTEAGFLLGALEHMAKRGFWGAYDAQDEALALVREWSSQLAAVRGHKLKS